MATKKKTEIVTSADAAPMAPAAPIVAAAPAAETAETAKTAEAQDIQDTETAENPGNTEVELEYMGDAEMEKRWQLAGMGRYTFRNFRAEELEIKPDRVERGNILFLLYANGQSCAEILAETFGPGGWKMEFPYRDLCRVSVRINGEWIPMEQVGAETAKEPAKGAATTAFKRACSFGWGIGRELYFPPKIRVKATPDNVLITTGTRNGQPYETYTFLDRYRVKSIGYEGKRIVKIEITDSQDRVVYRYDRTQTPVIDESVEYTEPEMTAEEIAQMDAEAAEQQPEPSAVQENTENPVPQIPAELPDNTDECDSPVAENRPADAIREDLMSDIRKTIAGHKIQYGGPRGLFTTYHVSSFEEMSEEQLSNCLVRLQSLFGTKN